MSYLYKALQLLVCAVGIIMDNRAGGIGNESLVLCWFFFYAIIDSTSLRTYTNIIHIESPLAISRSFEWSSIHLVHFMQTQPTDIHHASVECLSVYI